METIPLGTGDMLSPFVTQFFDSGNKIKILTVGRPSEYPARYNPLLVKLDGRSYAIAATAEHVATAAFQQFTMGLAPGTQLGTTTCSEYLSFALWTAAIQKVDPTVNGYLLNPTVAEPTAFAISFFRMSHTLSLCVALGADRVQLEELLEI